MKHLDSCSAIICQNNKILLFLRDDKSDIPAPNCWQLPGGRVEVGEIPESCIKRELEEEVTYVPKKLRFLTKLKMQDGMYVYIYYAFVNKNEAKKFKIGAFEGQDVSFFSLDEIKKLTLTPILRSYLRKNRKVLSKAMLNKSFTNFNINY
jgi:8-oxo-dGTP diphosphatase